MCHYEVVAKHTPPEVGSTYPFAFMCNTHEGDKPGEPWVAMYVDEIGDYLDPYGQKSTIIFSRAIYLPFVVNTVSLS